MTNKSKSRSNEPASILTQPSSDTKAASAGADALVRTETESLETLSESDKHDHHTEPIEEHDEPIIPATSSHFRPAGTI